MLTPEQVRQQISVLQDPVFERPLGELRIVEDVKVSDGAVQVTLALPIPGDAYRSRLEAVVSDSLQQLADVKSAEVSFRLAVRGKDAGGRIGLKIHNVIAVGSGKGGVGKSTVAASLACGLHAMGCRVGLMDADVYGPSIPHMMGAKGQPAAQDHETPEGQKFVRIQPVDVDGLKLMSMGFFIGEGQSVVWRGPMLHKALTQFLKDTEWGELDYLIIDLPPGTGDVALTLAQQVQLAGAVVVCTPQKVALLDAVKAVDMYQKVNVPILGFVENMSGAIFGRGGTRKVAEELKLPFLGELPIEACVREYSDAGAMQKLVSEENPAREPLLEMCRNTAERVAKNLVDQPAAPVLEIL